MALRKTEGGGGEYCDIITKQETKEGNETEERDEIMYLALLISTAVIIRKR